ncbi:MAG TPA: hypothetical protein VLD58_02030 [Gemmatimonadales bacterium]|nr:hypothetical protein [Gemmatimonadales bacterium]
MARLVSRSGKVSRLSYEVSGVRDGEEVPRHPYYLLDFLVNDAPARFRGYPIVGDGDFVTVAGFEADGVLNALAIRNRSTGVDYGEPSPFLYMACVAAAVVGLLTARYGLGLALLAVALWLGGRLRRSTRALSMVRAPEA